MGHSFRFEHDALPRAHAEQTNTPDQSNTQWKKYAEAAAGVGWVGPEGPPSALPPSGT